MTNKIIRVRISIEDVGAGSFPTPEESAEIIKKLGDDKDKMVNDLLDQIKLVICGDTSK